MCKQDEHDRLILAGLSYGQGILCSRRHPISEEVSERMAPVLLQQHAERVHELADAHVGHGDEEGQGAGRLEGPLCEEGPEDVGQHLGDIDVSIMLQIFKLLCNKQTQRYR